ncbi:MAG TPA: PAS domain S-box protein, partial [Spirochaetes bacterium]|nr:PAS domain S-box protein [Spirochaetota bacterium]
MRKIIQKMLSAYEKADAMTAMKARFIFYLCLAIGAVLTAAVVYTSILHLNNPAYGYRIRVPMLGGLAVLSLIIALLRRGRFRTASHLLMTGAFVVIWSIIINDRGDPLARLDTIIFIAAMIALTPIIVVGKGYSIAVYTLLNIAAMYLFMLAYHPGLELSKHSIWEYLADNTSAMLFVAVISYAIFTINRRTFDQTVRLNAELFRKNEELEATNEELQATIEELEATNEDFEAQNEELIAAENDLRQSEEKYRGLVENINEVIYSIDETGNILYMSPGIEKMTGFTLEEMAGENYTHFIHPDDLTYLVNDFDELSHGVVKPSEYRVKTKTGDYIWIMTASRPIFKNGIFAGATGVMTNIHQRRLAEETLRESEEKYRGLVENINEIVYSTDSKGAVSYVSPAITKTLGMAPEEIIGSQFLEFIYPEDREYLLSRFQRVVDGIFEPTEYRLALPSGDFRWVRSNSRPLYADGVFQGVSGIITDIHESKMAERKILQEKAFADAIIDT